MNLWTSNAIPFSLHNQPRWLGDEVVSNMASFVKMSRISSSSIQKKCPRLSYSKTLETTTRIEKLGSVPIFPLFRQKRERDSRDTQSNWSYSDMITFLPEKGRDWAGTVTASFSFALFTLLSFRFVWFCCCCCFLGTTLRPKFRR